MFAAEWTRHAKPQTPAAVNYLLCAGLDQRYPYENNFR
jgi:hypothetical protein